MNNYIDADIQCPYFASETEKSISCEGVEVDTKNTIRFKDIKAKMDYIKKHCIHFPNECPIFTAAEKKYMQALPEKAKPTCDLWVTSESLYLLG